MKIMKNTTWFKTLLALALALVLAVPFAASAQDDAPLSLSLSRDFGYSSGTGKIQGRFSMRVSGPDNLERVVFLIDGQPIGEASSPPFRLQFETGSYPLGVHTLSAVGYTSDGDELTSNEQKREFVSASSGMEAAGQILWPILLLVIVAIGAAFLAPALLYRGKKASLAPGTPRSYSPFGGTICPNCQRPYGLHIYGLNILVGKLDRCPYCGKWSIARRMPLEMLKTAEAAEMERLEPTLQTPQASPEEKLAKDLENSRYQDL